MRNWKIGFIVTLILFLLSNLSWFYSSLDQAATMKYIDMTIEEQKNAIEILSNLVIKGVNKLNYNQKDILHLLRQVYPDEFIVEKESTIFIHPLNFYFRENRLFKVSREK